MPSNLSTIPVGSDGHIPVGDTNSRWTMWALHQLFMGAGSPGEQKYVGKPGDWVVNITLGLFYRIASVHQTTYVPTLVQIAMPQQNTTVDEDSGNILGIGPGDQCQTQYVYFNDTVTPHSLAVDAAVFVGGTETSYARIFRGTNIFDESTCISRLYGQSNTLIDDKFQLELVQQDEVTNYAVKTIEPGHTASKLVNGEKVTVVVYSDQAVPIYVRQMLVIHTSFVRTVNSSQKHIINVSLKSPFIAPNEPDLIQFPLNVPMSGLNLTGVVHYSDGSTREYPVNGTRFAITGYEHFSATKPNETFQVCLHYYLQDDEYSYILGGGPTRHISKFVSCKVTSIDGAYNIKLFGYPKWSGEDTGYTMRWFAANLERTILQDVTASVRLNENTAPFNPLLYGVVQRVVASIYFNQINPAWKAVKHVQPMDVTLINPGTVHVSSNWSVSFSPSGNPVYGLECHALVSHTEGSAVWQLDLRSNETTLNAWLNKFYISTIPIKNQYLEVTPPQPTHFIVVVSGVEYEYAISEWATTLTVNNAPINSDTMLIKFIKRTVNQAAILLSIVGVPVWFN